MPLRKSNSELLTPSRQREPWQRSRSGPVTTSFTAARSFVPISAATRSKLESFHFHFQDDAVDNKENAAADSAAEHRKDHPLQDKTSPAGLSKDDSAITPAARTAWLDLELQADGGQEPSTSPSDRIMWNNKPDPIYASVLSSMATRRTRKRARSSSPTSSPSNNRPQPPPVNRKKLVQALRPHDANRTLEVWDSANDATPVGIDNPALAQLMVSSSPRPARTGQKGEGSLRKAIGLGRNWSKRRKLDRGDYAGGGREDTDEGSKAMLVSALLDTVTAKIHGAGAHRYQDEETRSPSPMEGEGEIVGTAPANLEESLPRAQEPTEQASPDATIVEAASDYGDDDLDDDTMVELAGGFEGAGVHTEAQLQSRNAKVPLTPATVSTTAAPMAAFSDDFGDLDDNILDIAEGIMASLEPGQVAAKAEGGKPIPTVTAVDDEADDPYGDDFDADFDFEAAELAATQMTRPAPTQSTIPPSQKPKAIQRYLVTNVVESEYVDDRNRHVPEKILLVQADTTKTLRTVHLRGEWHDTPAHTKSYIHIIGNFGADGRCIIDDNENMVILHPDQLISATVVADSFTCMRRAVLQDRVKATGDPTAPLIYGTILHEVFQAALMENRWGMSFLAETIESIMGRHVEDLYTIKVSLAIAREHLLSKMAELSSWARMFVSSQPRPDAVALDRGGKKANICVSNLLDVEEHVWSPMYGLKGNIDATVQVTIKDGASWKTLTVPFEVKTGKHANENHMAQTALYSLLLSDRYDIDVLCGILYYMETSQTLRIPAIRHELRHMIMQRNRLACHVRERSVQLPPMKRSKNTCGRCYAKDACFIYHRLADDGDGASSGMDKVFDVAVQHLQANHQQFFLKWEDLLTKEEKETQKLKRELWTMVSSDREKVGRCFSDVIIEEGSALEEESGSKINKFRYTFVKRKLAPDFSFLESQLVVGEPVVVSDEDGHFALALGYVTAVRKHRISVAVDRRLHNARIRQPGFNEVDNQVFASIMEVAPEGSPPEQTQGKIRSAPTRYRLDKDEFSNGMAVVRNNLVQVMIDGVFGAREIRRLVVDLAPPRFKEEPTQYVIKDRASLNVDQRRAIQKVMSAQDYALVLGMPGTGKTTTIAHIIRALTSQGKSVLLTSYTHTAVDNILLKLKQDNIPILRLGAAAKVHPEVRDFASLAARPMTTFEEIKEAWHDTPIVATTCLGIGHPLFRERTFDYCIVDEASQITLPVCLGPIRMARTFVLVGDHNQLPPLVQNEDARRGGLDVSLFKLLSDTHPESVVNLEHQYRMCEDIMTLSNTLIYHGRLRCGTEALRTIKLDVPNMAALKLRHYDSVSAFRPSMPKSFCTGPNATNCWLRELLEPEARVRFVNTDTLEPRAREEARGSRIVNQAEATVVVQLVEALITAGVPEQDVGVMTHYRSQLSLLRNGLRRRQDVEMHTADRFQGRDKEVVVLSLVRSNDGGNIGDLLRDWRRINVAFTRAKAKLLVVGSRETLRSCGKDEMVNKFVALMEERDWVYDLPPDALTSHCFEETGTQAASAAGGAGLGSSPVKGGSPSPRKSPLKKPALSPRASLAIKKGRLMREGGSWEWGAEADKENQVPGLQSARRAKIGEKVLMSGKVILRDILNDMAGGGY